MKRTKAKKAKRQPRKPVKRKATPVTRKELDEIERERQAAREPPPRLLAVPPHVPRHVIKAQLEQLLNQVAQMHTMVNFVLLQVRDQIVVRPTLLDDLEVQEKAARVTRRQSKR